jgi:hypothetical protein
MLERRGIMHGQDSLFHPVCDYDTENVEGELDCYELATRGVLGCLGSPDRYDRIEDAGSPAVD